MPPNPLSILPVRDEHGKLDQEGTLELFRSRILKRFLEQDQQAISFQVSIREIWSKRLPKLRRINLDALTTYVLADLRRPERDRQDIREQVKEFMAAETGFTVQQTGRQIFYHQHAAYPSTEEMQAAVLKTNGSNS